MNNFRTDGDGQAVKWKVPLDEKKKQTRNSTVVKLDGKKKRFNGRSRS